MPRGRPKQFQREVALVRALDVFWRRGFASAGLGELIEAMGIGRQSLYDTFGDKRALYLEALRRYGDEQVERFEERLFDAEETPGARLAGFLGSGGPLAGQELSRGCMVLHAVGAGEIEADPELASLLARHQKRLQGTLLRAASEAVDSGEVRQGVSAEVLAATLLAAVQGLFLLAPLGDTAAPAEQVRRGLIALLEPSARRAPVGEALPSPAASAAAAPVAPPPMRSTRVDSWKSPPGSRTRQRATRS